MTKIVEHPPAPDSTGGLLSRNVGELLNWNWEKTLYLLLIVAAFVTRFYDLGARVMSHDESLHTEYSWYLYQGRGYIHSPMMHGPLKFEVTAFTYWLLGDNDFLWDRKRNHEYCDLMEKKGLKAVLEPLSTAIREADDLATMIEMAERAELREVPPAHRLDGAVSGAHHQAVPGAPGQAHARSPVVPVRLHDITRHAIFTREQQLVLRRVENGNLVGRAEKG